MNEIGTQIYLIMMIRKIRGISVLFTKEQSEQAEAGEEEQQP